MESADVDFPEAFWFGSDFSQISSFTYGDADEVRAGPERPELVRRGRSWSGEAGAGPERAGSGPERAGSGPERAGSGPERPFSMLFLRLKTLKLFFTVKLSF